LLRVVDVCTIGHAARLAKGLAKLLLEIYQIQKLDLSFGQIKNSVEND